MTMPFKLALSGAPPPSRCSFRRSQPGVRRLTRNSYRPTSELSPDRPSGLGLPGPVALDFSSSQARSSSWDLRTAWSVGEAFAFRHHLRCADAFGGGDA